VSKSQIRGSHVFWAVFAFFSVVIAVDTFFIIGAVRSFPGEEVANSYVLGLNYNQEVAERERQVQLGWSAQAGLTEGDRVVLRIADRGGAPVHGLLVQASWFVVGKGRSEQTLLLHESSPGEYAGRLGAVAPARIELGFTAQQSGRIIFRAAKSLELS
jgi:nitrogen fixation protein FixH